MRTIEEIVEEVRLLSPQDRLRLVERIGGLGQDEGRVAEDIHLDALDTFLALAGSAKTTYTDVSSDKYTHLAEIYSDNHELP